MPIRLPTRWLPLCLVLGLSFGFGGCGDDAEEGAEHGWKEEPPVAPHVGDPIEEADAFIARKKISKQSRDWRLRLPKPPLLGFPTDKKVHWILETSKGRIVARLWEDVAPMHVSNVVYLTRLGFYDDLTIHRVVRNFMLQGGCPIGNGEGTPGYGLPLELKPGVKHDRAGLLSTARTGAPNSDGSQFFITFAASPFLDPVPGDWQRRGYTLFGEVVEGMEAVRAIEDVGVLPNSPPNRQAPRERIVIQRATVELR
jgi:peptidyl-prolyl cis-trans isomerase B (cyclophilin B)